MATVLVAIDGTTHTVTTRPVDNFGFVKWAGPRFGITAIADDYMAFAAYSAARALIRTGAVTGDVDDVLDRMEDLDMDPDGENPTQPDRPSTESPDSPSPGDASPTS